ncbi:hypothetical protein CLOM_g20331 [Closterium sp. NIES-68]|nr:hypothetical protein CLOM_g20331 [Closterium sp. NIES-68]
MEQVDLDEDVDEADYDEQDEEYWIRLSLCRAPLYMRTCQNRLAVGPLLERTRTSMLRPKSEVFMSTNLELQGIHNIRWLSRGDALVTVEGIDSDGRPSRFTFELHEEPQEDYPGPSDHDGSVVACMALAEGLVRNLDERLGDLRQLTSSRVGCGGLSRILG